MDPGDHSKIDPGDVDFVALAAGQTVGRYEIVATLGQGSFGITYRARDKRLGRDVAIKEYLPSALAIRHEGATVLPRSTKVSSDFTWGRDRFVAEGQTLASLQNAPAIVRVFDFLEANGTAYIVMQLLSGQTLEAHLKGKGRLTPAEVDRILWPLLDGLEQVHNAGFLHRDIKPGNILLDAQGNATLIDFGASRAAMAGRTVAMTAIFTPGYAAAEQFTSAKQGPWTDLYGVAATLYQAIAGKVPPSAFDRMVEDEYEPLTTLRPAGFAPGLLLGLDAALAVKAGDRPQSIAAWRALLRQTVSAESAATVMLPRPAPPAAIAAAAITRPEAAPAPSRKRAAIWIAASVAAVLVLAGGGYLAFAPSAKPPAALSVADAAAAERSRIDQQVQSARAALAAAEQAAKRQADEDTRQAADAEAKRKAEADAATKLRAEEEARRQAAAQSAQQRADAEAARKKADAEAAAKQKADEEEARRKADAETSERQRIQQEVQKARDALAVAEAARRQAEADTARFKAEAEAIAVKQAEIEARRKADAEARQKADADVAAKQKADAEVAAKLKTDAEAAAAAAAMKQKADADAAKQKADAEAAAKQKEQEGDKKAAEAAETGLRLATPDRQRLQVALSSVGFDTRGADGTFGPRSREMIAAWQRRQNQPATGFLTAAQRDELIRSAAPAISRWEDEQKKLEEAKRKAEADAKTAAAAAPASAAAPVSPPPAAAAPISAPAAAQPGAARDGLWFGAIDCKGSGRTSVQGMVSNGAGTLTGGVTSLRVQIAGENVSISVGASNDGNASGQGSAARARPAGGGQLSGKVSGRGVYAQGSVGGETCTVSLVGP